ncbi:MAG: domain containing protein [Nocardioidaceae bacterium]|nr:domain containing protein [Nocardioidaceae bacterium]
MRFSGNSARLVLALVAALVASTFAFGSVAQAADTAPAGTYFTVKLNNDSQGDSARFRKNERVWFRGHLYDGAGRPLAKKTVVIQADTGAGFRKILTVVTTKSGSFIIDKRPSTTIRFRAKFADVKSAKLTATLSSQTRTLESRAAALAFKLGARVSDISASSFKGKTVRQATFENGMLVTTGGSTWVVDGRIKTAYVKAGGPSGNLGGPIAEYTCRLYEGGCIQRFQNGVIYVNRHAKKTSVVVQGTGKAMMIVAAAQSQVGYREPSYRHSKYNVWMHRTGRYDAWCGYFLAWSSRVSGNGNAVIKAKTFAGMVAAEKRRGRLSSSPEVGKLAYIDYFRNKRSTHVGIVVKHQGAHIWTIEGNVSAGGGSGYPRGVRLVKRKESQVRFYAWPRF